MRLIAHIVLGLVWFAMVGGLAAAAPTMPWLELITAIAAVSINAVWLLDRIFNS
jgi:hypothetical protein